MQEDFLLDLIDCFKRLLKIVFRLLLSGLITLPFGVMAIEYAYRQRGYMAVGGEYCLIIWIFVIAFKLLRGIYEEKS